METTEILAIVNSGVSILAVLLSIILKRKSPVASKTLEEIGKEAEKKANKYIEKQCKKNKITLNTKSEDNSVLDTSTNQNITSSN